MIPAQYTEQRTILKLIKRQGRFAIYATKDSGANDTTMKYEVHIIQRIDGKEVNPTQYGAERFVCSDLPEAEEKLIQLCDIEQGKKALFTDGH